MAFGARNKPGRDIRRAAYSGKNTWDQGSHFFLPGDWVITLQGLDHCGLMRGPVLRPQPEGKPESGKEVSCPESCKLELSIAAIETP